LRDCAIRSCWQRPAAAAALASWGHGTKRPGSRDCWAPATAASRTVSSIQLSSYSIQLSSYFFDAKKIETATMSSQQDMLGLSALWESVSSAAGGLAATLGDADVETMKKETPRGAGGVSEGLLSAKGQRASAGVDEENVSRQGEEERSAENLEERSAENLRVKLCRRAHKGTCCAVHAPDAGGSMLHLQATERPPHGVEARARGADLRGSLPGCITAINQAMLFFNFEEYKVNSLSILSYKPGRPGIKYIYYTHTCLHIYIYKYTHIHIYECTHIYAYNNT